MAEEEYTVEELLLDGARYGDEEDVRNALDSGVDTNTAGPSGATGKLRCGKGTPACLWDMMAPGGGEDRWWCTQGAAAPGDDRGPGHGGSFGVPECIFQCRPTGLCISSRCHPPPLCSAAHGSGKRPRRRPANPASGRRGACAGRLLLPMLVQQMPCMRRHLCRLSRPACPLVQNVAAVNEEGNTPLHWAAMNRQCQAVRLLLAAGASPSAVNKWVTADPVFCWLNMSVVVVARNGHRHLSVLCGLPRRDATPLLLGVGQLSGVAKLPLVFGWQPREPPAAGTDCAHHGLAGHFLRNPLPLVLSPSPYLASCHRRAGRRRLRWTRRCGGDSTT